MNKLNFLLVFLLSISMNAQLSIFNVNIKMKDSSVFVDQVMANKNGLLSINTQDLYEYHKIEKFMIKQQPEPVTYVILEGKTYYKSKRPGQIGLGYRLYDSPKVELFQIYFGDNWEKIINRSNRYIEYREGVEIFIRRKGEKYAYNIGFIDGKGWYNIHKRIRAFFHDCPDLFKKMRKNDIGVKNIIQISDLYNEICD